MAVTVKQIMAIADRIREGKEDLEFLRDEKQEVLDNAESADYPNEERIEKLQNQVDTLETAIDELDNTISELENYE